ncbi:hypothetical protein HN876_00535 [archaeon]|nr:hypothetical protein [archaeon]MBT6606444.1 hypothetical protein [archaeon]MBT7251387.1 hypothetical protein [archaeon]
MLERCWTDGWRLYFSSSWRMVEAAGCLCDCTYAETFQMKCPGSDTALMKLKIQARTRRLANNKASENRDDTLTRHDSRRTRVHRY